MKLFVFSLLTVFSSLSIASEVKSDRQFNCTEDETGEIVFVNVKASREVVYSFQQSGKTEYSTIDIFAAKDALTLIAGELDQDGEALVKEYCSHAKEGFKSILNVNERIEKRFCLSCVNF